VTLLGSEGLWGIVGVLVWSLGCMGEVFVGAGVQWRCWSWLGVSEGLGRVQKYVIFIAQSCPYIHNLRSCDCLSHQFK
jgi:hypothetical protein